MQTDMDLAKTAISDRYRNKRLRGGKIAYLMNAREEGLYRDSRKGFDSNAVLLF